MKFVTYTFLAALIVWSSACSSSKSREATSDAEGGLGAPAPETPGGNLSEVPIDTATTQILLAKDTQYTSAIVGLTEEIEGVEFSFNPENSTCDEFPWSEQFLVNADGTLAGNPTSHGTCRLAVIASIGEVSTEHQMTLRVTGCGTKQQTLTIQAGEDDGYYHGFKFRNNQDEMWAGNWEAFGSDMVRRHELFSFFRFQLSESIKPGSEIQSATFRIHGAGPGTATPVPLRIYAYKQSNLSAPIQGEMPNLFAGTPLTAESVYWDVNATYTHLGWNTAPDVATTIQEILDISQNGLVSNEYIGLLLGPDAITVNNGDAGFATFENGIGMPANVEISWNECTEASQLPTLEFTSPSTKIETARNSSVTIAWQDEDVDSNANINFYFVNDNASADCTTGLVIQTDVSENDNSDTLDFSIPAAQASGSYHVCAIVSDADSQIVVRSLPIIVRNTCTWTGIASEDWTSATNWDNTDCNNTIPTKWDDVVIPNVGSQPRIDAQIEINNIGSGTGGGYITLDSADRRHLILRGGFIKSDIELRAQSASCTTCGIYVEGDLYITEDATLTLQEDLVVLIPTDKRVYVGDGSTPGHLVTAAGAIAKARWPRIAPVRLESDHWSGIVVNGTSSSKSSTDFDGLSLVDTLFYIDSIHFESHFDIIDMDRVSIDKNREYTTGAVLNIDTCDTESDISSTQWTDIIFEQPTGNGNIIAAETCTNESPITLDGSQAIAAPGYASSHHWYDPGLFVFTGTPRTCTFNKASGLWKDAANWDNCLNGKNDWPDADDSVIIPAGRVVTIETDGNSATNDLPTVGTIAGGGGSIMFTDDHYLIGGAYDLFISGDITIGSDSLDRCSECGLWSRGDLWVDTNATLTLEDGAIVVVDQNVIKVGSGFTGGTLETNVAGSSETRYAMIHTRDGSGAFYGINVEGNGPANLASVSLNKLIIQNFSNTTTALIDFINHYTIGQFDNVIFNDNLGLQNTNYIRFQNCANATLSDQTWTDIGFHQPVGTGFNIDACSTLPVATTLSIDDRSSGSNQGYGASFEVDPGNKVSWP